RRRGQGAGQQDTGPLAAGHFGHAPIGQMTDLDLIERAAGGGQGLGPRQERRAEGGDLGGGQVPGDAALLRKIGGALGAGASRQARDVVARQAGRPARQRQQAREGAYQAGLAGPVGTDQGQQLARLHPQVGAVQHGAAAQSRRGGRHAEPGRHSRHSRAARQAIRANSGAPTRAVNTPSLRSWAGGVARASRSATTSICRPASAEGSSSRAGSPRTAVLTRCGAARPTKRMTPATATAAPVARDAASRASSRSRAIGRPEVRAVSSPRLSMRRPGAARAAKAAETSTAGLTQATSNQLRFCTEPSSQFITSAVAIGDGDRLKISAVAAPAKLDTATPNRIRASGDRTRAEKATSRPPARPAPARAASSTAPGSAAQPSTMAPAAPSAARAETPSTPGSASGLRSRPCITAPDRPRAAPTIRAVAARGARTAHSTSAGPEVGSVKARVSWARLKA